MFGIAFPAFQLMRFFFFFFFFLTRFVPLAATVNVRYMNSSRNIWPVFREQYTYVLFTDPQILFFINFFIKNGSHDTIYTFKNYFTTVISAISFQFQQNKFYPNRPKEVKPSHVLEVHAYYFNESSLSSLSNKLYMFKLGFLSNKLKLFHELID